MRAVDHPRRPAARAASSRPCLLCLTGNGIQCEQSTTPTARPLARPPPAPFQGAGSKWRLPRIPCTGRKRDFMEISVRPIRACLLQGTVSMGNRPCGEAARRGGGWNIPLPCPDVSPGTVFVEHPFPCLLRLWLNVFRLTNPRLPSMPSRKKPHHAAVTRGIPHEDGGCTFIQIPVTPPGICPRSAHGEVYQTSEALV